MKKTLIVAVMAIAAVVFTGCNNSQNKSGMKNDVDSLSYAAGVLRGPMMQQAMQQLGIDSAYQKEVIKGIRDGIKGSDDKKKAAYNVGIILGMQLQMMQEQAGQQIFEGDSTKSLSIKQMANGFIAAGTGKRLKMTEQQAQQVFQAKVMALQMKSAEKKYGNRRQAADKWMAANAKKAGVKKLGRGVQYSVEKTGNGPIPRQNQTVEVNYTLKTTDGKVVETTEGRGSAHMPLDHVIPGFTEAITHMTAGSKWIVYIPYSAGYGAQDMGPIKPFSNLIFEIELVGIDKPGESAAPAMPQQPQK